MFRRPCNDKMKRNYFVRRKTNVSFELNTSLTSHHMFHGFPIGNSDIFLQHKQESFSSVEKLGKIGIRDWQFVKTCGEQQSVSFKIRNPGCGYTGKCIAWQQNMVSSVRWIVEFLRDHSNIM